MKNAAVETMKGWVSCLAVLYLMKTLVCVACVDIYDGAFSYRAFLARKQQTARLRKNCEAIDGNQE